MSDFHHALHGLFGQEAIDPSDFSAPFHGPEGPKGIFNDRSDGSKIKADSFFLVVPTYNEGTIDTAQGHSIELVLKVEVVAVSLPVRMTSTSVHQGHCP